MKIKKIMSFIAQMLTSFVLYFIFYKGFQNTFYTLKYYFWGDNSFLSKAPGLSLEDLMFIKSFFHTVYLLIPFVIFLSIYFPSSHYLKRKYIIKRTKRYLNGSHSDELSNFFLRSPHFFEKVVQEKRYLVSKREELPTEKIKILIEKRKSAKDKNRVKK